MSHWCGPPIGALRAAMASLLYGWLFGVEAARNCLRSAAAMPEPPRAGRKQLLVDVSTIARRDSGTGIQRVVRTVLGELLNEPPEKCDVRPVYATRWHGYRYADHYRSALEGKGFSVGTGDRVSVRAGDVFLGMDLAAQAIPQHRFQVGLWKASGVRFCFVVYDLLPVLHPEWFNPRTVEAYRSWIRTVATLADCASCISQSVSEELRSWLTATYGKVVSQSIHATWFHLGGDFSTYTPDPDPREKPGHLPASVNERPSILMVGTIEPRKGYAQTLSAFEKLWREGRDFNLVIVGKAGWKVGGLVERLRNHPEAGSRLIWIQDATDQMLYALYRAVNGLLMASEGEGFGLPIVEAARHGKPMLLRDIPVFREIANGHAQFFSGTTDDALAAAISSWMQQIQDGTATPSRGMTVLTWRDSAKKLIGSLSIA